MFPASSPARDTLFSLRKISPFIFATLALTLAAAPAAAQPALSGWTVTGDTQVQIGENQFALRGNAEIEQGDTKLYADDIVFFPNEDRAVATGNVLFSQGNNRIGADTAEFNTKTRLGTFFHAYGIANIQPPRRPPSAGVILPAVTNQQTDVYFFGDSVEKIGPRKYKITNGGFTTCVQPTPRWDLAADTVVLHVNDYTLLRDAVLRVKGVPLLYLPFMYYPTKEDERATGILIPTYGASSVRGQSLHNAFFWAIDRSQDATFFYDWYSKAGEGGGTRVPLQLGRRIGRHHARLRAQSARRRRDHASRAQLRDQWRRQPDAARRSSRKAERRLLLEPGDHADLPHGRLRRVQEPAGVRREHRRRLEHLFVECHRQP